MEDLMKLTTRSRYGTRMVLDIAQHDGEGPVRIGDIAKRQKVSVKYLEKLIRELRDAGLINSRRGPKGGHMLGKPAEDISVGEVVRVLEGHRHLVYCVRGKDKCERSEDCLTRQLWRIASEAMFDKLDSISFADLVNDQTKCLGNGDHEED
jgi:Rrf2 family protein